MSKERLIFNGIDAAGGELLLPPVTPRQISAVAQGEPSVIRTVVVIALVRRPIPEQTHRSALQW